MRSIDPHDELIIWLFDYLIIWLFASGSVDISD